MGIDQVAFGLDNLSLEPAPLPELGPNDVHVRLRAASLNYRDLMVVLGQYNPKMQLPRILGSDAAGEVVAVGSAVTRFKTGDRVCSLFFQDWLDGEIQPLTGRSALGGTIDGVFATERILPERGLIHAPAHLSFEEAATLPCAAVTAWNALAAGNLKPDSTILIQGTGGVSIFALQFAKARGLRVLGISSSAAKLDRATDLGLDQGFDYGANSEWDQWVLDETGGEGVDLIVEVGGAGTLPRSIRALKMGGLIAQIGVLSGPAEHIPIPMVLHKQLRIQGIYVGSRHDFEEMKETVASARLRPVFECRPWAKAPEVLRQMESAKHFGKLVVRID